MSLINKLSNKQKRSIQRDIDLIFSVKGIFIPKTIDDLKEIGFFAPRIKVNEKEVYLSKDGVGSIRRICRFVYESKLFKGMLSYDDIFHAVSDEIEYWINKELIPEGDEFILPLESRLLNKIDEYVFVCRIDGLSLENIESISIGKRAIKQFNSEIISELSGKSEFILKDIDNEYPGSLIIFGMEEGSSTVAQKKFYHNSELSLSVLRLYSCSHSTQGIKRTNIRLINNCINAYGPASSFGWNCSDKIINFTRYFISEHELKIDADILVHWRRECFFEKISGLIDKLNRNELEESIIKSLYWLGESQKDRSDASSWVKLWSCLECFFTFGEDEITEKNARGISSILVFGGYYHEQYRDYESLKKKIKKFYGLRSKVVHHAEYTHIEEHLLLEFSYIVAWVIITMASLIDRGYTQLSQIREKVDRLESSPLSK